MFIQLVCLAGSKGPKNPKFPVHRRHKISPTSYKNLNVYNKAMTSRETTATTYHGKRARVIARSRSRPEDSYHIA